MGERFGTSGPIGRRPGAHSFVVNEVVSSLRHGECLATRSGMRNGSGLAREAPSAGRAGSTGG